MQAHPPLPVLRRARRCMLHDLPLDLVVRIISMAAPEVWQQVSCRHEEGRQDLVHAVVPQPLTAAEQACAWASLMHAPELLSCTGCRKHCADLLFRRPEAKMGCTESVVLSLMLLATPRPAIRAALCCCCRHAMHQHIVACCR